VLLTAIAIIVVCVAKRRKDDKKPFPLGSGHYANVPSPNEQYTSAGDLPAASAADETYGDVFVGGAELDMMNVAEAAAATAPREYTSARDLPAAALPNAPYGDVFVGASELENMNAEARQAAAASQL